MKTLTEKQQKFVDAKLAGLNNTSAAVEAGYSRQTAKITGAQLMNHPGIVAAIAEGEQKSGKTVQKKAKSDKGSTDLLQSTFESSLHLMQSVYNDLTLPFGVRFEAAKQALPYEHGKIGEKGKKEGRKEAAKEGATEGKFKVGKPPTRKSHLSVVK